MTPTVSKVLAALCVVASAPAVATAQTNTPGAAVLQQMHDAYAGKWYNTLRFVQKTTQYRPDGSAVISTWYETLRQTPNATQLRIDFGDPHLGNAVLYTADSSWRFREGKLASAAASGNEFLPLIEGVYVQPVAQTVAELKSTKVDMSRVADGTWNGKPVKIIGVSNASDASAPQIWVETERNLVVRMIMAGNSPADAMDVHLEDFVKAGEGWLATKVTMSVGGKPRQTEEYADWRVGMDLPEAMFSLTNWITPVHWAYR